MSEERKHIDQRLFDWCVDSAHKLIEKGYAAAWFNWLGWVALTSAFMFVAEKSESVLLYAVALMSVVVLFFVGIAGIEKFMDESVKKLKYPFWVEMLLAIFISSLGLAIVFEVLGAITSFAYSQQGH